MPSSIPEQQKRNNLTFQFLCLTCNTSTSFSTYRNIFFSLLHLGTITPWEWSREREKSTIYSLDQLFSIPHTRKRFKTLSMTTSLNMLQLETSGIFVGILRTLLNMSAVFLLRLYVLLLKGFTERLSSVLSICIQKTKRTSCHSELKSKQFATFFV